jgi:hypothetical protein
MTAIAPAPGAASGFKGPMCKFATFETPFMIARQNKRAVQAMVGKARGNATRRDRHFEP